MTSAQGSTVTPFFLTNCMPCLSTLYSRGTCPGWPHLGAATGYGERPSTWGGTSQNSGRNHRVWGGRGADRLRGGSTGTLTKHYIIAHKLTHETDETSDIKDSRLRSTLRVRASLSESFSESLEVSMLMQNKAYNM